MRDRNFILSLERGIRILEIFGESSRWLTLTEVAKLINLTKTTTQRFLHTLHSIGYLNMDENKRYSLSIKILSLGFSFLNSSNLTKLAKPYIDELSSELNKTVNLVVLDNLEIIYLYRKEVRRFLNYDLLAGSRLPAHCTAAGKILLAGLTDEELTKRINKAELNRLTPRTIISKKLLREEIIKARKRGYSISDRELSMDLYSLAVPLLIEQGKMVASINVTMDAKDTDSQIKKESIFKLIEKGEQISRLLGYQGPYPQFPS
jgi:IclR family pca regulon transcriptional regulator